MMTAAYAKILFLSPIWGTADIFVAVILLRGDGARGSGVQRIQLVPDPDTQQELSMFSKVIMICCCNGCMGKLELITSSGLACD